MLIGYKKITQEVLSVALPMIITQLIAVGSGILSLAMMSRLGHDVLAASALIYSARITIFITCSSILFSLSILIGHAYGEKEYRRIGNFIQQGWIFGILISVPVMFVFWNIQPILLYFGQEKLITEIVQEFFRANIWNVLPFMLSVCNQQLCYGTRKQKIDMTANLLGVIVLIVSSIILIFGKLGMPALGVKGLAYALNIQGWFYFLCTTTIIFSHPFFKIVGLKTFELKNRWDDITKMIKIGSPIAIQIGAEMLSTFALAAMVGWLGVTSLAAYQIVNQYFFLIMVPLFALAQASGVLIGMANGEKNVLKIKMFGNTAITIALVITFFVGIIYLIFPKVLTGMYLDVNDTSNKMIVHDVLQLFAVCAVLQIFDAIRNVLTGSLRGLFDTRFPMYVGLVAIWLIGIPCGYVFAFHLKLGVVGVLLGSTVGMFVGMIILFFRWRKTVLH